MLPPQHYTERDQIRDGAYAAAGVSRSSAAGMKPAGVTSGVGIREARDEASGRQLPIAEALEAFDERNASTALALMRVAYAKKKGMRIKAPNTRMLEEIDWDEVGDLAEDEIEVRAFITSAIPNTAAGREETLEEWVQNDVISRKRAIRWQSDPDLANLEDEDAAQEDFCRKLIESAIDDGKEMAPEPVMGQEGLAMLHELAVKALMESLTMPEPPPARNLDLLRRLIKATEDLITPPAPPAPAMPATMPGAPLAAPPPPQPCRPLWRPDSRRPPCPIRSHPSLRPRPPPMLLSSARPRPARPTTWPKPRKKRGGGYGGGASRPRPHGAVAQAGAQARGRRARDPHHQAGR
jgi:hypothetical protein